MYVYLTLCFMVMGYVAFTVSIVQSYLSLSVGNYHWQWKSFIVGFTVGAHTFMIVAYFSFFLEDDSTASVRVSYRLWTMLMSLLLGLVAGACSFMGSLYFVRKIYSQA